MNYTQEELEILEAIENSTIEKASFDKSAIQASALQTLEYLHQKKQVTINMKQYDLDIIKTKAKNIGISYQHIIQALIHNYATGKIELKI